MVKIILFITVLFIILFSCKSQKLTIERGDYDNMILPLRINGGYCEKNGSSERYVKILFLYSNGIRFGNEVKERRLFKDSVDKVIRAYESIGKNFKSNWGIYNIKENVIELETWEPSSGGGMKTVVHRGKILNDTCFVITQQLNHYDGKTYNIQDTFKFFKHFPKPDSTNRFIKE